MAANSFLLPLLGLRAVLSVLQLLLTYLVHLRNSASRMGGMSLQSDLSFSQRFMLHKFFNALTFSRAQTPELEAQLRSSHNIVA